MRAHLPRDVQFIYVMRHPIDRLVSQYVHEWTQRVVRCSIDEALDRNPEMIVYSRYAMQLQPFIEAFGRERILPLFFERMIAQPQETLERVCRFIGYQQRPQWKDEADEQNVSSERMRSSGVRDVIINLPGLKTLRRTLVPQAWRDRIKGLWQMKERPQLSDASMKRLRETFDEDLATLGSWLGENTLRCDNFKRIVLEHVSTWRALARVPAA
jgi:hypothetical protein